MHRMVVDTKDIGSLLFKTVLENNIGNNIVLVFFENCFCFLNFVLFLFGNQTCYLCFRKTQKTCLVFSFFML